ncbi:MAG: 50S ribosomal protein L19 [Deltaproteobacteria bacterium]|nr:50S ribosomal protein L19 [Deltaproteobacteria bacterium]
MDRVIQEIEKLQFRQDIPSFKPGDTVKVYFKIKEGDKERLQLFEGVVIRIKGSGLGKSVTVRKISYGVGVEKIFPIHSPSINRVEVVTTGHVRRAKLYYLRKLVGKAAKVKEKRYFQAEEGAQEDSSAVSE